MTMCSRRASRSSSSVISFEAEANGEFEDFQSYAQQLKNQGDTIIADIQAATILNDHVFKASQPLVQLGRLLREPCGNITG